MMGWSKTLDAVFQTYLKTLHEVTTGNTLTFTIPPCLAGPQHHTRAKQ
jgi:hypothetical protein